MRMAESIFFGISDFRSISHTEVPKYLCYETSPNFLMIESHRLYKMTEYNNLMTIFDGFSALPLTVRVWLVHACPLANGGAQVINYMSRV